MTENNDQIKSSNPEDCGNWKHISDPIVQVLDKLNKKIRGNMQGVQK